MHWELLPAQAAFSCRVGSIIKGFQAFPQFPQWLGKNSTTGKFKRLTQELVLHSSLAIGQGFSAVRMEYVPYLRSMLMKPLLTKGAEGAEEVISG
jgi:replication factor C subunit 1